MRTIHKYILPLADSQVANMPEGAKILSVQTQHDNICIWAEVDTDNPLECRTFEIVGTGNTMPIGILCFIGTVQWGGRFVWHIFERPKA